MVSHCTHKKVHGIPYVTFLCFFFFNDGLWRILEWSYLVIFHVFFYIAK